MSIKDTIARGEAVLRERRWADDPFVRAGKIAHYQKQFTDAKVEEWTQVDGEQYLVVNRDGKRTLERIAE